MSNNERLGASFSIDVTNLKAGLAQANRLIRESESEFKAAAAGLDDWSKSEQGINARIKSLNNITDIQRQKVDALTKEYDSLIDNGLDPTSKQATELRTKINNETAALNKNEAELKKQTKALENLENSADDAGDELDNVAEGSNSAGDGLSGLKAAGGIAVSAVAAVGAACAAAAAALIGLAESTRESRTNMAKLETSFTTAGHSAQEATNTYKELYSILGDEGQATEAAQHLAKLTTNQQELSEWTNIATGVYATFGDSLPIEGLTEAANETAKTGALTGSLADALNWAGVNEESFQKSLDKCRTEQERQALITETLNGLYSDSAQAYRENNAEVIAAQKAQSNLNDTLNELGEIAEPIMTKVKNSIGGLLSTLTPFISQIGSGLTGALSGSETAATDLANGISGAMTTILDAIVATMPNIINAVVTMVPELLNSLVQQLPVILETLMQMLSDIAIALSDMMPILIPSLIDGVIMCAHTLLDNIDTMIDAGMKLIDGVGDGIVNAFPKIINNLPSLINKLVRAIATNAPKFLSTGLELILKLGAGLIKAIPDLIKKVPEIISAIVDGLKDSFGDIVETGKDLVRGLWQGISDMVGWIIDKVKGFGSSVLNGLKSFFGINSPSKLMEEQIGKNLALGIGKGFDDNIAEVNDKIVEAMNFDGANVNVHSNNTGDRTNGGQVIVYQTNNYSQAHSRFEIYKSKQLTTAAVRLALQGA